MIKTFKSTDKTQLTEHFNVQEFRCKCGGTHDTKLDTALVDKLEQLRTALNCSKIVVNSGYRCALHDRNVGGSGSGMHVNGCAADIVCYDKNNNKISSKKVCCVAQDMNFGGIANIDSTYTATHVDTRTANFWKGDEVVTSTYSVTDDFYKYYGLSKSKNSVIVELQKILNKNGANLATDGIAGAKTLAEIQKYTIDEGDTGELVQWVQSRLNEKGYNSGNADGIAGIRTMSAIAKFQTENGLGTGHLGGSDWNVLLK